MRSLLSRSSSVLGCGLFLLAACSSGPAPTASTVGAGTADGGGVDPGENPPTGTDKDGDGGPGIPSGKDAETPGCSAGKVMCPKGCVDIATDTTSCGSCGLACPTPPPGVLSVCAAGKCLQGCAGGATICTSNGGAYCTTLTSDLANCGSCGTTCTALGATPTCQNGKCGALCPAGKTFCGNTCLDLDNDPNNCGACGTLCSTKAAAKGIVSGQLSCVQGKCIATVNDDAGVNCTNGNCQQSCNDICQGKLKVPCDPDTRPSNCQNSSLQTGSCGYYYKAFGAGDVSCAIGSSCSAKPAGAFQCSGSQVGIPLAGINCRCSGVVQL